VLTPVNFPGAEWTSPLGTNNAGDIVGVYGRADGTIGSFLLSGGTYSELYGNLYIQAQAINNLGMIVGTDFYGPGEATGFLIDGGTIGAVMFPGSIQTQVYGINDLGELVGQYEDASGNYYSFVGTIPQNYTPTPLPTATPEPASVLLFGAGLAVFGGLRRKPCLRRRGKSGVNPLRASLCDERERPRVLTGIGIGD
jgi:hypothetical protein